MLDDGKSDWCRHVSLPAEELARSVYLLEPCRPVLITTLDLDGGVNLAPFSWVIPCSQRPPKVCTCFLAEPQPQRTLVNIEREREFVINIVGVDKAELLLRSAAKVYPPGGKASYVGVHLIPSVTARTPRLEEARACIECRVSQIVPAGDHVLVVGDVVAASYDLGSYNPWLTIRLDRWSPCLHVKQFTAAGRDVHLMLTVSGMYSFEV